MRLVSRLALAAALALAVGAPARAEESSAYLLGSNQLWPTIIPDQTFNALLTTTTPAVLVAGNAAQTVYISGFVVYNSSAMATGVTLEYSTDPACATNTTPIFTFGSLSSAVQPITFGSLTGPAAPLVPAGDTFCAVASASGASVTVLGAFAQH